MRFRSKIVPYEGEKIATATSMAHMEKGAISDGDGSGEDYMTRAADGVFEVLLKYLGTNSHCTILCAKGNNSGDGYSVAERLHDREIPVIVYQLFPKDACSKLCQEHMGAFEAKGGQVVFIDTIDQFEIQPKSVILDSLLGTGFHGRVEGLMAQVIEKVNASETLVLSVDIPSGVPGDTGLVEGPAIFANLTIYLGLLKVGHFYNDGYEHIGDITGVNFGISQSYIDDLDPFGYLVRSSSLKKNIPRPKRTSNKYTIGQTLILAGSVNMPGAGIIASTAALRAGAGLVKLFHLPKMESLLSSLPPEVIRTPFTADHMESFFSELPRTKSILVGPGLGTSDDVRVILDKIYERVKCPIVIDADGLYFFDGVSVPAVLTPHRGEAVRLLGVDKDITDLELIEKMQQFANDQDVVVVLKGAPTTILSPGEPLIVIPAGNPGMASGGMGDALAGIIASLIAQGLDVRGGAILGVLLHGLAGDRTKERMSMHSMTASDLIVSLSHIFRETIE